MSTSTTTTGTIGQGTAVHALRIVDIPGGTAAFDLCGSSFYRNGRPQRKRVTDQPLSTVTCAKCLKALATTK
jgi:hypothetical protein